MTSRPQALQPQESVGDPASPADRPPSPEIAELVLRRLSSAGLELVGAQSLLPGSSLGRRIAALALELDRVVAAIRLAVLDAFTPSPRDESRLGGQALEAGTEKPADQRSTGRSRA